MTNREKVIAHLKKGKPVSMWKLAYLTGQTTRELRKTIAALREKLIDGKVIVAGEKGYYLTNESEAVNRWLHRYLGQAFAKIKTARTAKKFLKRSQVAKFQAAFKF